MNTQDDYDWTPLMYAAYLITPNPAVITILIDAGADLTLKSSGGKSAFDYAKNNESLNGTVQFDLLNSMK